MMGQINIDFLPSYAPFIEETLRGEDLYTGLLSEALSSEASFRSLWNHLDTNGIDGESKIASDCVRAISEAVSQMCSHVTAFHGCRVYSEETYREKGIQKSDTEAILKNAIERFGSEEQVRKIYAALQRQGYTTHNGGKVYGVKSMKHHMENGGFCHAKGSELLGIIASRMSPNMEANLYSSGEPSIIEYLVPIDSLKESDSLRAYVASLLQIFISKLAPYDRPNDPRCGGIIVAHDIGRELLVRRYLCDDDGYALRVAEEYSQ